ncbi:O-antigen ligase family protein [Streptococcus hyovaginalis]
MKSITNTLFYIIILNMIPAALLGTFQISSSLYTLLFALVFLLQIIMIYNVLGRKSLKITRNQFLIFILFLIVEVISNLYSAIFFEKFDSNEFLVVFSVTLNIFFFIISISNYRVQYSDLYRFFFKIVQAGSFACFINLLLNYKEILSISSLTNSYVAEFSSFFSNRNTFGVLMLITIISNKYLIESSYYKFANLFQIFFFVNLLLTFSRTSIAGALLFYLLFYYFNYVRYNYKIGLSKALSIILLIFIVALAILFMLTNDFIINRLNILLFRIDNLESGSGRFDVWRSGFEIGTSNNFVFGLGRYKALELKEKFYHNSLNYFHSIYIEVFVTYGLIGFTMLIMYFRHIIKKISHSSFFGKNITYSSIFSFMFICLFESTTRFSIGYADTISLIFFFSIPILIGNMKTDEDIKNEVV